MFSIAIVEDEENCREQLRGFIGRYFKENGKEAEVTAFTNGIDFVSDYRPVYDIVLMDIEMPHLNGMAAAKKMRRMDPDVCLIFVTNLAQYALEGYSVSAADFIVKPVEYFTFAAKLQKAINRVQQTQKQYIMVPVEAETRRLFVRDIRYIEVRGHFLTFHLIGEAFTARGNLGKLEEELQQKGHFFRIFKSYLVNLDHVTGINQNSALVGEDELLISRSRKQKFLCELGEYLGNYRI